MTYSMCTIFWCFIVLTFHMTTVRLRNAEPLHARDEMVT